MYYAVLGLILRRLRLMTSWQMLIVTVGENLHTVQSVFLDALKSEYIKAYWCVSQSTITGTGTNRSEILLSKITKRQITNETRR